MAHIELDLRERRAIEDMLNAKMPVSKIAVETGRHATICRDIKRNFFLRCFETASPPSSALANSQ